MATKAADQLVSVCMDVQVKHVLCCPGVSKSTTVDAYWRQQDKIKFVQDCQVEVAALAAASTAKQSGGLGVVCSIGGPGAIHLCNGL